MGIIKLINSTLRLEPVFRKRRLAQVNSSGKHARKHDNPPGNAWDRFVKNIICLSFIGALSSAVSNAGINSAAFLNAGVGARALGMGGAFTAIADDSSAPCWNPAGLGNMKKISIGSMIQQTGSFEHETLEDVTPRYNFFNLILPFSKIMVPDKGVVSVSIINTSLDKIPYTCLSSEGHVVRREVADSENAFIVSYGRKMLIDGLSLGAGLRYVTQSISDIPDGSASGQGVELGAYYIMDEKFRFGFVTQTGIAMKWDNGHTDYGSMRNRAGVSYNAYDSGAISVLTSVDLLQAQKRPLEAHCGSELAVNIENDETNVSLSKLKLRAGVDGIAIEDRYHMQGRINENIKLTAGLGLDMRIAVSKVSLDYAIGSTSLGDRHRISFSLYF
ncbi:MAG: hypothetical protein ABII23_03415 [bacterium]